MGRRPLLATLLLVVAAVAVVGAALATSMGRRSDGPLVSESEILVEWSLAPGQHGTWGMVLPRNETIEAMEIEAIEPTGVDGLEILGVLVSRPAIDGSLVNAVGFPPTGVDTHPPAGAQLSPAGTGGVDAEIQALIGVRLADGSAAGRIEGLRVLYRHAGERYAVVLPWAMQLTAAP